jgi:hypothetical protein
LVSSPSACASLNPCGVQILRNSPTAPAVAKPHSHHRSPCRLCHCRRPIPRLPFSPRYSPHAVPYTTEAPHVAASFQALPHRHMPCSQQPLFSQLVPPPVPHNACRRPTHAALHEPRSALLPGCQRRPLPLYCRDRKSLPKPWMIRQCRAHQVGCMLH